MDFKIDILIVNNLLILSVQNQVMFKILVGVKRSTLPFIFQGLMSTCGPSLCSGLLVEVVASLSKIRYCIYVARCVKVLLPTVMAIHLTVNKLVV